MHITKVKSVNLDKWVPEMVEMYKHLNNTIVNSYWEAKLPKGYNKPGQSASGSEVEAFIRDKYINKRWVENIKAGDPAWLYWNDRKKFDKYVKKLLEQDAHQSGEEEEEEPKKKSKKSKKSKKQESEEEEEEEELPKSKHQTASLKAPPGAAQKHTNPAPVGDLINLDAAPVKQISGFDGFLDF